MQAGQILAKEFGLSGDKILATSYGNSENGFLALQNGKLYLVDRKITVLPILIYKQTLSATYKMC